MRDYSSMFNSKAKKENSKEKFMKFGENFYQNICIFCCRTRHEMFVIVYVDLLNIVNVSFNVLRFLNFLP